MSTSLEATLFDLTYIDQSRERLSIQGVGHHHLPSVAGIVDLEWVEVCHYSVEEVIVWRLWGEWSGMDGGEGVDNLRSCHHLLPQL